MKFTRPPRTTAKSNITGKVHTNVPINLSLIVALTKSKQDDLYRIGFSTISKDVDVVLFWYFETESARDTSFNMLGE